VGFADNDVSRGRRNSPKGNPTMMPREEGTRGEREEGQFEEEAEVPEEKNYWGGGRKTGG